MKKVKAYTLMEMLIVMSIMIIVLSLGVYSYIAYIETTKYNQDVANLQSDITAMQRASMLFKKDADDGWVYGV
ncbi:MAG: Prepilin-type cleavage/methylation, N-terminal, partial [candidate division WS6 bacterium 34_10]